MRDSTYASSILWNSIYRGASCVGGIIIIDIDASCILRAIDARCRCGSANLQKLCAR